jgi:hypothetical protein
MTLYQANRHFTYAGLRVEPGMVFPKLAVKNNDVLESRRHVEIYHGKEEDLADCPKCPAKFVDHNYMQRHVELNVHKNGKVIHSNEGIRTQEQEEEVDALMKSIPRERPGRVVADPEGNMTSAPRGARRR